MATGTKTRRRTSIGTAPIRDDLEALIADARSKLADEQREDGHWLFELEADATIPAEYILYHHFLGEIGGDYPEIEAKIANYLRRIQSEDHGGWPLFHAGDFDMSTSVKAYYALKIAGDDTDAPHMKRARDAIVSRGGAAKSNVFTRMTLYLFRQVPWRAVPAMPVEIVLLPRWFPFHISKVSYWSRTVMLPLLVLMAKRASAENPRGVGIPELFVTPPEKERHYHQNPTGSVWGAALLQVDKLLRVVEPVLPKRTRRKAVDQAMAFSLERANGLDGLGAIFPAMVNLVEAMEVLGYPKNHPDLVQAKQAIENLLVVQEDEAYCQPCLSPVWDTALAGHAMLEAGWDKDDPRIKTAADWLVEREIKDVKGDWQWQAPDLEPGGWAFQYWNNYYPDVDDTAVVGLLLDRVGEPEYRDAIARAENWIIGMQSSNGGWAAFDIDNDKYYLNHIPFADHGALLDPPTEDVSARCLSFLAQLGHKKGEPVIDRGIKYLKDTQQEDGSWFGRWGTNYIYGTWSVLCALNAAGEDMTQPYIRKAVDWLKARQQADGGWGEDGATYWEERRAEVKESTPSQTAWALLALMAAGEVEDTAVEKGVRYLKNAEREGPRWQEEWFTAVGFPRVFYLRYHGYSAYFPLWALARYRNMKQSNAKHPAWGM